MLSKSIEASQIYFLYSGVIKLIFCRSNQVHFVRHKNDHTYNVINLYYELTNIIVISARFVLLFHQSFILPIFFPWDRCRDLNIPLLFCGIGLNPWKSYQNLPSLEKHPLIIPHQLSWSIISLFRPIAGPIHATPAWDHVPYIHQNTRRLF